MFDKPTQHHRAGSTSTKRKKTDTESPGGPSSVAPSPLAAKGSRVKKPRSSQAGSEFGAYETIATGDGGEDEDDVSMGSSVPPPGNFSYQEDQDKSIDPTLQSLDPTFQGETNDGNHVAPSL